jgi:hypothetical protein
VAIRNTLQWLARSLTVMSIPRSTIAIVRFMRWRETRARTVAGGVGELDPVGHRSDYPNWAEFGHLGSGWQRFSLRPADPLASIHMDVSWGLNWRDDLRDVAHQAQAANVAFATPRARRRRQRQRPPMSLNIYSRPSTAWCVTQSSNIPKLRRLSGPHFAGIRSVRLGTHEATWPCRADPSVWALMAKGDGYRRASAA